MFSAQSMGIIPPHLSTYCTAAGGGGGGGGGAGAGSNEDTTNSIIAVAECTSNSKPRFPAFFPLWRNLIAAT